MTNGGRELDEAALAASDTVAVVGVVLSSPWRSWLAATFFKEKRDRRVFGVGRDTDTIVTGVRGRVRGCVCANMRAMVQLSSH